MYSSGEAQAMDYLLKKLHYKELLQQIIGNESELKLVIAFNNSYMSRNFIKFQKGSIEQYEIVDSYDYEKLYYSNQSISTHVELWSLFCEKYLPRRESYSIKNISDLTVAFDPLNETVRAISFANEATSLRPLYMNIEYFNEEKGPNFLYLGNRQIEIVSIVKRETV